MDTTVVANAKGEKEKFTSTFKTRFSRNKKGDLVANMVRKDGHLKIKVVFSEIEEEEFQKAFNNEK